MYFIKKYTLFLAPPFKMKKGSHRKIKNTNERWYINSQLDKILVIPKHESGCINIQLNRFPKMIVDV